MRQTTIYGLVDPNSKVLRYVGQTISIKRRLAAHLTAARKGDQSHKSRWIRRLLGQEKVPIMIIIETVPERAANDTERFWIALFRRIKTPLTNISDGGELSNLGMKFSAEHRAKIAAAHRGKIVSKETRERMRAAHVGKKLPLEQRAKMSETHRRKARENPGPVVMMTDEVRAKISATKKGTPIRPRSPEHQAKLTATHIGRKYSPETRKRMSEAKKKMWRDRRALTTG